MFGHKGKEGKKLMMDFVRYCLLRHVPIKRIRDHYEKKYFALL